MSSNLEGSLLLEATILFALLIIVRVLYLVHKIATGHSKISSSRVKAAKTLVCIGSGGHTTEILTLIETLDFTKYSPRYYVIATTDNTSKQKVLQMESKKQNEKFSISYVPRSRKVGQPYFTSIFTTIYSILKTAPIVVKIRPDLILCNGPGTCIPICIIAFMLKAAFIIDTKIVFIESFCRTKNFSLTAKILFYFADNILVQWPGLKKKLKRADYIGQLL